MFSDIQHTLEELGELIHDLKHFTSYALQGTLIAAKYGARQSFIWWGGNVYLDREMMEDPEFTPLWLNRTFHVTSIIGIPIHILMGALASVIFLMTEILWPSCIKTIKIGFNIYEKIIEDNAKRIEYYQSFFKSKKRLDYDSESSSDYEDDQERDESIEASNPFENSDKASSFPTISKNLEGKKIQEQRDKMLIPPTSDSSVHQHTTHTTSSQSLHHKENFSLNAKEIDNQTQVRGCIRRRNNKNSSN